MPYQITLRFPPSVNRYWRHVVIRGQPRSLLSKPARQYRDDVIAAVLAAGQPETFTGPVEVDVVYRAPDRRRRDVDNYHKGILDALQHAGVFADDRQVWRLAHAWALGDTGRIVVEPPGSAIVTIKPLVVEPALFAKHGEGEVNDRTNQ